MQPDARPGPISPGSSSIYRAGSYAPLCLIAAFAALLGTVAAGLWWLEQLTLPLVIHAALMTTVWAAIMPAGALIARYAKVTRRQRFPDELDNRL